MRERVSIARLIQGVWIAGIFGYLILPTIIVIVMSFGRDYILAFPPRLFSVRWYLEFARSADWTSATIRSIGVATLTALLAVFIGSSAALAMVRGALPGRRVIELVAISPIVVPPIVIAVGGYSLFVQLRLVGSLVGLTILHTLLAVPFVVLIVSAALYRNDPYLELASMSLGGGRWKTLTRVTFPLILPSMLTGGLFAFLVSFDEVVLALFIVGTTAPTLPLKIFSALTFGVTPVVAAVSSLQIGLSVMALVLLGLLKREGASETVPSTRDKR